VHLVHDVYWWVDWVLYWGMVILYGWSVFDCAIRKAASFPAADKLTKPAWLAITVIGGLLGALMGLTYGPTNVLSLIALVAALVYLCDVRPAVREVSGGSRW
jgi:hypothetical protein